MKAGLRIPLLLILGTIALGGAGLVALQVAIGRGAFSGEIDAALDRTIGRAVTHGAVSVRFGLRPRIVMLDASVANLAGGSRPDFARIGRLEVTLALLPLFGGRVEIDRLRITDAEITLERDNEGRGNWIFGAGGDMPAGSGLDIAAVEIEASRILMPGGTVASLEVGSLRLSRDGRAGPVGIDAEVRLDGEPLSLAARLGPERDEAMPVEATIQGQSLRVALRGTWPRGPQAPGWSLALDASAGPDAVRRLAVRLGIGLPAAAPLRLAARIGAGSPAPVVSDLTLSVGAADLGGLLPGLHLARGEVRAASFDDPVTIAAQGRRGASDMGMAVRLPSLRRLTAWTAGETMPVEAELTSGRSRLVLSGPVGRELDPGATVLDARLTTPDFAQLAPLLGVGLPRITGVTASARVGGLFTREMRLDGLSMAADGAEIEGELAIALAPRLAFRGRLAARRLDLDVLGGTVPPRRRSTAGLIPDIALPADALRHADATLRLSATRLVAGGATWRDASGTVALAGGRLAIDPLQVTTPGGAVAGRAVLDASPSVPRLELQLNSRGVGLDLAALRRAFGVPAAFDGSAELALDLRGHGATTRAVFATLSGEAGIAMVGGRFTGATSLRIGPDLARALLPRGVPSGGLALRCLALRLSAEDGMARSEVLLVEGDFGRIEGRLALNLRDETIAARLLPDISVMGVTVRAPIGIGGTMAEPRLGVEPGAALARVFGDTVANRLWRNSTLDFLRDATGSARAGGDCAPALAQARLGRPGRMPEAPPMPIPLVPREIQGAAQEVLRGLGGLLGGQRR